MKISKIKIRNYRSLRDVDLNVAEFNVFVGQNNHGKTNLFEAIEWFFNGPKKGEQIETIRHVSANMNEEVFVEIAFTEILSGLAGMKNEKNKKTLNECFAQATNISIRRTSNDPKKRIVFIEGVRLDKNPVGFDNALNDFFPQFEYVETKVKLQDVAVYKSTSPIGSMLSGVLMALLETNQEYKEFRDTFLKLFKQETSEIRIKLDEISGKVKLFLEKQFPDCIKVSFEIGQPAFEDLLKGFETSVDDGVETIASDKGDGMQRALMLAIIQTYAEYRKNHQEEFKDKRFIFLFDEGELHLHPTAQRKLKSALLDIVNQGDQVFLNTHSSVLVAEEHEKQSIFKVEKIDKCTQVDMISKQDKRYVIYELLGGSPIDLLLPNNFIIVEGRSEWTFLKKVIERFYLDKPEIQVIYAEGDHTKQSKSMDGIHKVFNPLHLTPLYKNKLILLCDKPHNSKKSDFDKFTSNYDLGERLCVIPFESLEEYYPSPWKNNPDNLGKVSLAEMVGKNIKQNDFENGMNVVFQALSHCWEKAYQ